MGFSFDEKASKKSSIFAILLSKVRGLVRFLGGLVVSMFGSQEQTGGSVDSRFGFWRFGRFGIFRFDPTLLRVLVYGISEVTTNYRLILACFVFHLSHKILLEFGNIFPHQNKSSENIIIFFICLICC